MSEQDKTGGNESKNSMMTRRTTLTLAAAVATFGAAMGMRAPAAWAQGKMEGDNDERNVSTILRQPSVEFKLGCLAFSAVD